MFNSLKVPGCALCGGGGISPPPSWQCVCVSSLLVEEEALSPKKIRVADVASW